MIKAILVFNNHGKPRFMRFYQHFTEEMQQQIVRETFHLVSKRDDNVCNFLEGGSLIGGSDYKLIYRHYATLYFVFCVDSSESELGILDLIQVFPEGYRVNSHTCSPTMRTMSTACTATPYPHRFLSRTKILAHKRAQKSGPGSVPHPLAHQSLSVGGDEDVHQLRGRLIPSRLVPAGDL
ncbi:unnamed protein product [Ranitomeya imitator]|uniref:AP complex mu/sigma subunit domain-containing protein n=1 Tax=Ranitomeya imitator TaxID=111125 RepID=A0ABN9KZI3_9NEOB|nr:unnamed protein product [Ranitomeya imitator]